MTIMSNRDEFLGAHTTPEVKEALEIEKQKTGKSVSLLIHEAVMEKLRERGYKVGVEAA